jgi:hypothetical protein
MKPDILFIIVFTVLVMWTIQRCADEEKTRSDASEEMDY